MLLFNTLTFFLQASRAFPLVFDLEQLVTSSSRDIRAEFLTGR